MKSICIVPECTKVAYCKNMCQFHYDRKRRYPGMPLNEFKNKRNCGEFNHKWRGGVSDYPQYRTLLKNKAILLEHYPICQICEIAKSTEVHHVDLSKDNHNLNNLLAVCRKCHLKTFHNKKKTSKYILLYGKTLREIGLEWNCSYETARRRLS